MMKFLATAFAAATAMGQYTNDATGFVQWYHAHGKNYTSTELDTRFAVWQENFKFVEGHNELAAKDPDTYSYTVAMNVHADMTNEEYRTRFLGFKKPNRSNGAIGTFDASKVAAPPAAADWRTHTPAVVSPIKNQGQCGSCWAFSAVEAMEAAAALKTGAAVEIGAPQQLVDCVNGGAQTCDIGGEMHDGYLEVMKDGGLDKESCYPYTASSGNKCRFKSTCVVDGTTAFKGYKNVTQGDETALMAAAATVPTISIGIDASSMGFQLYHSGVYNPLFCKNNMDGLDHGVAIVGYGAEDGKNYWTVRNSWGEMWGMKGYVNMIKDHSNKCGVATDATYPVYD